MAVTPQLIIQEAYADFGRGDIPALLARLDRDVEWATNVDPKLPGVANVPCYAPGRGPEFVAGYFQKFAAGYDIHRFELRSILAGGDEVAVRLAIDVTVRRTGKRVVTEVLHLWTVTAAGKIARFLDVEDTLAFVHAWN